MTVHARKKARTADGLVETLTKERDEARKAAIYFRSICYDQPTPQEISNARVMGAPEWLLQWEAEPELQPGLPGLG